MLSYYDAETGDGDEYAHAGIAAATLLLTLATCCLHGDGSGG